MPLHLGPAYRKAIEIYAEVGGQPGRSLRFSSALVLPYLALSPIVLPEQRLGAAGPGMMALAVLQFVLMFCVSIVLAIRWHRYVLLGEDDARFLTVPFGRRELRYFGRSLLVGIVTMAVMISTVVPFGILVGMVLANGGFAGAIAPLLLAGVAYLLGILVIARLGLVFPAVAIDREAKLAASWRATRAHWCPFFSCSFWWACRRSWS
jgi:hypothetical protein